MFWLVNEVAMFNIFFIYVCFIGSWSESLKNTAIDDSELCAFQKGRKVNFLQSYAMQDVQ